MTECDLIFLKFPNSKFSMQDWLLLGAIVFQKKKIMTQKEFKKKFKLCSKLVNEIFKKVEPYKISRKYLLWTLYYLRTFTESEEEIALALRIDLRTMQSNVMKTLKCLQLALPRVCKNRILSYNNNNSDSFFFQIQEMEIFVTFLLGRYYICENQDAKFKSLGIL